MKSLQVAIGAALLGGAIISITLPDLSVAAAAPQAVSNGQFTRDPVRAKANLRRVIASLPGDNAALLEDLEAVDFFAVLDRELKSAGLDSQNVFDVMALVWVVSWNLHNGSSADTEPAVFNAVKAQIRATGENSPEMRSATNATKQDMADEMLVRTILVGTATEELLKQGPEQVKQAKAAGRQLAQSLLQVDITQFRVDRDGISQLGGVPVVATATAAGRPPARSTSQKGMPTLAQLKQASAALPAPLRSAKLVKREYYNSYNAYSLEVWMLLPGGLAAQCPRVDVASIRLDRAWFKAQKCDVGDWRAGGKGYQVRIENTQDWDDTISTKPMTAGLTFEAKLRSSSGGSINGGPEGVTSSVVSSGAFLIRRDGTLATRMQTSVSASGAGVFAGRNSPQEAAAFTYYINGYIITLGFPDGHIEHRYAVFEVENGQLEYAYFNDNFYFND